MRIFISGGCKNGKSYYAQRLALGQGKTPLYYIATMRPVDDEDVARIARHVSEREGYGFVTIEQPADIAEVLGKSDHDGSFLLDSLTALLANEMFLPDGSINGGAGTKITDDLALVLNKVKSVVVVSDFIFSDAEARSPLTEAYMKALAAIDRAAAELCDAVIEIAYSNIIVHKGAGRDAGTRYSGRQKGMQAYEALF